MHYSYAPVILFVYNRPEHTLKTVEALKLNVLASESDLFVFADGPKVDASEEQLDRIKRVREYLPTISGFKSVHIEQSEKNKGLAKSIIYGVTKIVNQYGRVIVLEDDIITSSHFLQYMNQSLALYENDDEVACIHGYSLIKDAPIKENTYFIYGADCWGWATWNRSWDLFNPNAQELSTRLEADKRSRKLFTFNDTYPYMEMLQDQIEGKVDSWAIRWYASAVINRKLCLYPTKSLVQNIGFGEGTHTNDSDVHEATIVSDETTTYFPKIPLQESKIMRSEWEKVFKQQYPKQKLSLWTKMKRKMKGLIC